MLQKRIAATLSLVWLLTGGLTAGADSRGPIEYPGMKVLVDSNGVQALSYSFANECQKPEAWRAKWIWLAGENNATAAMFRKEIVLPNEPRSAKAWLTADAHYRLLINGRLVSRGPVDMGRDYAGGNTHRWFYDFRDLQPFLKPGTNVIAAEVFRNWTGWTVSHGKPGFLFEAEIVDADGKTERVASDSQWRSEIAAQFTSFSVYNAGEEPADWRLPGFDDSKWDLSSEVTDVWSPLVASEIPPLMEARYPVLRVEGLPSSKVITNDCSFRVVFDRVLSAYPTLKVKGGRGAKITVKANNEAKMILGGGEQFFEFPHMTEVVPAFTVTLKGVTEPVTIEEVGAIFTSQPVEYRGAFQCSDDKLNRLYDVSRWAVQICLQTHHLDSPNHQEPISDPGDYLIESMVNYQAFAQPWLARQDIRKFAWLLKDENYHNFHTSYSIGWLQMLMDYYDYTGDQSLVEEMSPYVHELLDTYTSWRGTNGIISEAPNYMFMDWVKIGGFECHHPPAVIGQGYLTALYYHGLEMASRVAALAGDSARVAKYATLRQEIAGAFNRELWVADKGLYRDGQPFQTSVKPGPWLPADKDIETFSPHVNLLAVLYDLAPKQNQAAIVSKVMAEKPLNTQPWFMHWVFQAIEHAGLFDEYATPQMYRWQIVPETQSFREMWNGGDFSHGWCSTPLVQMSSKILGITPTAPGFKLISIRPQLCNLTWAKGKVPTPNGDVKVAWSLQDGKFALDITVPTDAAADVELPVERFENPTVTLADNKISAKVRVMSGQHRFEVTGKLKQLPVPTSDEPTNALKNNAGDDDVVMNDLLHRLQATATDHATHTGGGVNAGAVFNGTTRNGQGGSETMDDGKTFRGYGQGDWLEFQFKQPADLTEVRSFSNHSDARASQDYDLLVARADAPKQFVKVATGFKASNGGLTEVRLPLNEKNVVAIRFEFRDGPVGFNVYREFNCLAAASTQTSALDLRPLRNPVWISKDNVRDPSVLKTKEGYHLFYSRFSGQTAGWGDPRNWHIAEVFTKDFLTFTNNRDISPAGCASPGDVVWWQGRWVLPYQTYPGKPTQLVFAESTNLIDWSAPRPFLAEALTLPWNELQRVIDPSFVVDGDTLHCWFVGSAYHTNENSDKFKVNLMGHAITRDPKLEKWEITTPTLPLIGISTNAPDGVENTMVFRTGDHWAMIYSEGLINQHLARATSPDLINWKLEGPVEIPRQKWMTHKFGAPFVWRDGDRWLMILMGAVAEDRTTFGLLSSPDGRQWKSLNEG